MNKITKLTVDQKAQLAVYRDKWIEYGLSCEPVSMERAVEAVKLAIECANRVNETTILTPTVWKFALSPNEAFKIAKKRKPEITINNFFYNTLWGCHDSDWVSFYDYMQTVVGVKNLENIEGLRQMAMHCGWVTIIDDLCIVQDRPRYIKFDEQNRSHCENGPAIEYRDGYSVMMWHGVRIPREWITNGITAAEALTVENVELRRAACEIVGWQNILEQLSYRVIDRDEDPMIGTLVEVDLPISDEETSKERFLMVRCGTGRDFALPVPPEMTLAIQANAWTYGLEAHEYNPEVRT